GRRDMGPGGAARAADCDVGMEPGDGGEGAGGDADGRRATRQAGGARPRARALHRSRGAAEGARRPRLLLAQRDVGEEPAAAVPRLARVADAGLGQRREGRHRAAGILMGAPSRRAAIGAALLVCATAAAMAQVRFDGFGFGDRRRAFHTLPNVPYDGRFTFVRVSYETAPGGYWWRGQPSWSHGYPIAEKNLMRIMNEVSYLGAHDAEINTLTLDDPELFRYPVAYIIEVSWWTLTDPQAAALRTYMEKGGFVIVDDFKAYGDFGSPGWEVFEANMKRVLPEARLFEMSASHPIFHSFFEINNLDMIPQAYNAGKPIFRGIYEDNDPSKR